MSDYSTFPNIVCLYMHCCWKSSHQEGGLGSFNKLNVCDCSLCRKHFSVLYILKTYHRVSSQINTTGATSGLGTAHVTRAHEFTPGFQWSSCHSIFRFMCMFCKSLFVLFPLAIVMSALRFTDSDYPFGIFKLF